MPNMDEEEEKRKMNPESPDGIYVTASMETQCRLITQKRNTKEEEKIKKTKVNALKRAACMNQHAKLFSKIVANLPNDMMDSEDPSTHPPLQFPLLSLNCHHQGLL